MTLRSRIQVVVAVGTVLFLAAVLSIGSVFPNLFRTTDEVSERLLPAASALVDVRVDQSEMRGRLRAWALNGQERDLEEHMRLRAEAESSLIALTDYIVGVGDPDLEERFRAFDEAHRTYVAQVSDRVIALREQGAAVDALVLAFSEEANSRFATADAAYVALRDALFERRDAQVEQQQDSLVRLGGALASIAIVMAVLVGVGYLTMRDWVLVPMERIRDQLRVVARHGGHETPIEPSGPPELTALARDAEQMRRQLVSEIDSARAAREALGQDAPGVAAIRRELFPDLPNPTIDGFTVHGIQQPAQGVLAGDWWDCVHLGDGRLAVCVVDVAGHGPTSGIAALRVKHTVSLVLSIGGTPAQAMRRVAETFEEEQSLFATAFLIVIDPQARRGTWVNAGHVPPLLVSSAGRQETLDPTGPLLSTLGGDWRVADLTFHPGDVLLIPTDGLTESHDDTGEILGEHGFAAIEKEHHRRADGEIDDLVNRMVATIRDRAVDWGRDDATLVGIRFSG